MAWCVTPLCVFGSIWDGGESSAVNVRRACLSTLWTRPLWEVIDEEKSGSLLLSS